MRGASPKRTDQPLRWTANEAPSEASPSFPREAGAPKKALREAQDGPLAKLARI